MNNTMPELQIGDVVSGVEVVQTTSCAARLAVRGTFNGSNVPNPLKNTFSVWLDNAAATQRVMGREIASTRRANVTARNIKKIERSGVVIWVA